MISDKNYYYLLEETRLLNRIRYVLESGETIDKNRFKSMLESVTVERVHEEPMWSIVKVIRQDPLINVSFSIPSGELLMHFLIRSLTLSTKS